MFGMNERSLDDQLNDFIQFVAERADLVEAELVDEIERHFSWDAIDAFIAVMLGNSLMQAEATDYLSPSIK